MGVQVKTICIFELELNGIKAAHAINLIRRHIGRGQCLVEPEINLSISRR